MRSKLFASGLGIMLGVGSPIGGMVVLHEGAIAQQNISEIDRAASEGYRLYQEGSKNSLIAAVIQLRIVLKLGQAENNKERQSWALFWIGKIYGELQENQKALEYYNQALILDKNSGDSASEAKTLNGIGQVYSELGNYQRALNYFNQSLPISRAVNDRLGEAATLNNIGLVYTKVGERPKSLDYFSQALFIFRVVKDEFGEASALSNIASLYDELGDRQKSLEYFNQALSIDRALGNRWGESTTLNNIGLVYNKLGQLEKALEYYKQALLLRRTVGDPSSEAVTLGNIGSVYSDLGKQKEALEYYNQAWSLSQVAGNQSTSAFILNNIALAYSRLGQNQKAIDYYNQSLQIVQTIGNRPTEGSILIHLGQIYDELGENEKALRYYNEGLLIVGAISDRSNEALSLNNIGLILAEQNKPQLAIVFLKKSVSIYETLRQDIWTLPKEVQMSYTKTVEKPYRNLASLLLKADRILEAQQVLDLLKVQELNNYLKNVRGASQPIENLPPEAEILKKYTGIQQNAIALGQELTTLRQTSESERSTQQKQRITQLTQLEEDLNRQFNEFADRPDIQKLVQSLSPKVRIQTIDTADLNSLRANLKQLNAVMIYPLILDDRLELIITTADSAPLRRTVNVKREDLNKAILEFRNALQNKDDRIEIYAQKLYNWLIKPLEDDLKTSNPKTLIYAPDGQLRYIPIAALHDGKQWLIERYAINHITSKSLTNLTQQPKQQPKILAGAIGGKATESNKVTVGTRLFEFQGLPFTTREIDAIQALQPTTNSLKGDQFVLPNVKPKFADYNILHLATHAAIVPGKPEDSFILFNNQTVATLKEIENWTLSNFDLVVLSACETGLAGNFGTNGEEILGLGYQFQNRGAKATIASLWRVDDPATARFMEQFYTYLKSGSTKAQALQQTQTDFVSGKLKLQDLSLAPRFAEPLPDSAESRPSSDRSTRSEKLSHPFYWAPFILIGNGL